MKVYIIQDHYWVVGVSQLRVEPAHPKISQMQAERTDGVGETASLSSKIKESEWVEESQLILASTSIALYITQLGVELILGVDEKTATYLAVELDALMLECES